MATCQRIARKFRFGLRIEFKVLEDHDNLALYPKHWKLSQLGCTLRVVVNGNRSRAMTRHVDSSAGDGVDKNITSFVLRERDHLSSDYCDLITTGMNRVDITVEPAATSVHTSYARLLSCEERECRRL